MGINFKKMTYLGLTIFGLLDLPHAYGMSDHFEEQYQRGFVMQQDMSPAEKERVKKKIKEKDKRKELEWNENMKCRNKEKEIQTLK